MDFVLFVFAAIRGITVLLSGIVSGLNLQWMGCSMFAQRIPCSKGSCVRDYLTDGAYFQA